MSTPPGALRVLIIEDEPRYRALLDREILAMGHVPTACPTAEDALARLEEARFDAALVDLHLPGMGGMEFFDTVRPRWPELAVVILTGFGDMPTAIQALRWDAVDFLTKPCGLDEIERALSKIQQALCDRQESAIEALQKTDQESEQFPAVDDDGSPRSLADIEREHILDVLARNNSHKPAAAEELGVSLRTLYNKLAAYEDQGFLSEDET